MKQFEKYIFFKVFWPMLVITLGITGIAWLSQSLKFIDFIVNKGLSISKFVYLSTLIVPSLMFVIIPVGVFLSVIYAYNKLLSESELIIFKAAGINTYGIIRPVLIFVLLFTVISYGISMYFLPKSYREFKDMQNFIRNNYASVLIQEGVFSNPSKDITIYIKERDKSGLFKGLLIHNLKSKTKEITIMAQEAYIENTSEGPVFVLLKGSHQEVDKKTQKTSILYFDKYNLFLDMLKNKSVSKRRREPKERYINELLHPKKSDIENDKRFERKLLAEGHQRITLPLTNLILALLAVIPFITGNFSRRGSNKNITKIVPVAILYLLLAVASKSLVSKNPNYVFLMYLQPVICLAGIYLVTFKSHIFEGNPQKNKVRKKRASSAKTKTKKKAANA